MALVFQIVGFQPDYAVHPGETLKELLAEANITQAGLARAIGISTKHLSQIITGKVRISVATALLLERELRVSAEFWMRMQAHYDVHTARESS